MKLEDLQSQFPKMPESMKVMVEKEVNKQIKTKRKYDYIFCDEVQDLTSRILIKMKDQTRYMLIVAGDSNQSIYSKDPQYQEAVVIPEKITQLIDSEDIKTIGFSLPDWEYPLLKNFYQEKKKIYSINVNNISSVIPQKISNLDCVISNKKVEFIIFNNKKLYNKTPNNNYIWCYQ